MNPFEKFNEWFDREKTLSKVQIPEACCLSTIGLDGYPNARFVSLKALINEEFIFTGPINSRKGIEILNNSKTALTFWMIETNRQIRIQGDAGKISEDDSDKYFYKRNYSSQLVSSISEQGNVIEDLKLLEERVNRLAELSQDKKIQRPADWGGYFISPIRIEFMEFNTNRLHNRILYHKVGNGWRSELLQP